MHVIRLAVYVIGLAVYMVGLAVQMMGRWVLDMPGAYDRRFTVYVPERVPAYKVQKVSMHRAVGWSWWKLCVVDIHAE